MEVEVERRTEKVCVCARVRSHTSRECLRTEIRVKVTEDVWLCAHHDPYSSKIWADFSTQNGYKRVCV